MAEHDMTTDMREIGARIKSFCLALLLERTAAVLYNLLDHRFMRNLIDWRGARCHVPGGRMPICLPDAHFCTAWTAGTSHTGATPIGLDSAQFPFTSPEVSPHEFFNAEFAAVSRSVYRHDTARYKRRFGTGRRTDRLPKPADGAGVP